jgi:hypothetical protein
MLTRVFWHLILEAFRHFAAPFLWFLFDKHNQSNKIATAPKNDWE